MSELTAEEKLFCKLAIKYNILSKLQIKECLRKRKFEKMHKPLAIFLIENGYLTDQKLDEVMSIHEK
ncbi:MAG TPA: hypothetical protein PKM32_07840, partial [Planctomycetota bacterium]|nr:hypothetical protein [Planctomycetota bacterium]